MEIFVGNLPFDITEQNIKDKFSEIGEVASVRMLTDKLTGRFRGIAFVSFDDDDVARNAIDILDGADLGGRPMRVDKNKAIEYRFNGFGGGFAPKKKEFKSRPQKRNFSQEGEQSEDSTKPFKKSFKDFKKRPHNTSKYAGKKGKDFRFKRDDGDFKRTPKHEERPRSRIFY